MLGRDHLQQTVTLDNKCATMDMQDVVELQRQETVLAEECIATVAKATHAVHASLHEATGGNVAPLLANEYAQAVHKVGTEHWPVSVWPAWSVGTAASIGKALQRPMNAA
jgi:hypothetical protein